MNKNTLYIKQKAISSLGYFDKFSKSEIEQAIRISQVLEFDPLETILAEDKGLFSFTYFVLSGECMILQRLRTKVTERNGNKKYELLPIDDDDDLLQNTEKEDQQSKIQKLINMTRNKLATKIACGLQSLNKLTEGFGMDDDAFDNEKENPITSLKSNKESKLENVFIDVGTLTKYGIFGLGEPYEHREIMARTKVQCLLLPRYWLYEEIHNPENIWNRRLFYINLYIPTRENLFKDFLATRKWKKYKKDVIDIEMKNIRSLDSAKIQDIPIICQIIE